MASQDCPNCHYPAPNRKKPGEGERVPQGMYHAPGRVPPVLLPAGGSGGKAGGGVSPVLLPARGRAEAGGGQGGRLLSVLL